MGPGTRQERQGAREQWAAGLKGTDSGDRSKTGDEHLSECVVTIPCTIRSARIQEQTHISTVSVGYTVDVLGTPGAFGFHNGYLIFLDERLGVLTGR